MPHPPRSAAAAAACATMLLLPLWGCSPADPPPTGQQAALTRMAESAQPEGENSWPLYRALIVDTFEYSFQSDGSSIIGMNPAGALRDTHEPKGVLGAPWEDVRARADLTPVFDRLDTALARLDEAAALPGFLPVYTFDDSSLSESPSIQPDGESFKILLPWLTPMRHLGIMNLMGLRASAHAGDWQDATQRVRSGLAMSHQLTRSPVIVEWATATSLRRITLEEIRRTLAEHDVPASTLRSWIELLEHDAWPDGSMKIALRGDRFGILDEIAWTYAGVSTPYDGIERESRWRLPRRSTTERIANEWYDALEAWWDTPAQERPQDIQFDQSRIEKNPLLARVMPDLHRLRWQKDAIVTHTQATLAALRVALHRAERGALPATLADAMPENDAKDPLSGNVLVYAPGEDRTDRRFTLEAPWLEKHAPWRSPFMRAQEHIDDRAFMSPPR